MKILALSLTLIVGLSSICDAQLISRRTLATQDGMKEMELYGVDFTEVLWYISTPIEIERLSTVDPKSAEGQDLMSKGKINVKGGKIYEIARFTSNATGLYEYQKGDVIGIRFEHGEGRILEFKLTSPKNPSSSNTVKYYELVYKSNRDGSNKKVDYAGAQWDLMMGSYSRLEFKAKVNQKNKANKNRIKGMTKDGSEKETIREKIGL